MADARRLACEALVRIDEGDAYANIVVPAMLERSSLEARDRRDSSRDHSPLTRDESYHLIDTSDRSVEEVVEEMVGVVRGS